MVHNTSREPRSTFLAQSLPAAGVILLLASVLLAAGESEELTCDQHCSGMKCTGYTARHIPCCCHDPLQQHKCKCVMFDCPQNQEDQCPT